jgi:hypothetical protein
MGQPVVPVPLQLLRVLFRSVTAVLSFLSCSLPTAMVSRCGRYLTLWITNNLLLVHGACTNEPSQDGIGMGPQIPQDGFIDYTGGYVCCNDRHKPKLVESRHFRPEPMRIYDSSYDTTAHAHEKGPPRRYQELLPPASVCELLPPSAPAPFNVLLLFLVAT